MKVNYLLVGGIGFFVLLLMKANTGSAASSTFNLSSFNGSYGSNNTARLQNALNALAAQNLSSLQLQMMLAQVLQETGLFTDSPNYNATDNDNNYSGISSGGSLKQYGSANDWATDYIRVLSMGNNPPINATNISDFNTYLYANGYYTDSPTTYGNNLTYYFNLLNQA
jgi:hypothetical protein